MAIIPTSLTPPEILEASLKKEKAAYRFYEGLLKRTNVEFVRELLEKLREEEGKHIKMIEDKIGHLNAGKGI